MDETRTLHAAGRLPVSVTMAPPESLTELREKADLNVPRIERALRVNLGLAAALKGEEKYPFGASNAVAALRKLADQIEAGEALTQQMSESTVASHDDYAMNVLTIVFAVKLCP